MDPKERINSPKYKSWIKGTLALVQICDIVKVFVKDIFDDFYQQLPDNGSHFDSGNNVKWMCGFTEWNPRRGEWELTTTHPCECQDLFEWVLDTHRTRDRSVGFDNCRKKAVPVSWGIAQLFMPRYCDNVTSPDDTDPYALFTTILNCRLFDVSHEHVENIIRGRNAMMHSTTNTLEDSEIENLFDAMDNFLTEAYVQSHNKTTKQMLDSCRSKVSEILTSDITTSLLSGKAKEALERKRSMIKECIIDKLVLGNLDRKQLEKYFDILEKLAGDLAFWNKYEWDKAQEMRSAAWLIAFLCVCALACSIVAWCMGWS